MTKRSKRQYRNRYDRAMNDMNWHWDNDGYEYAEDVPNRFRRNKIDGVLGGVCSGLGDYIGIDPVVIRILAVIALFMTGFFPIGVIYIVLWMIVPADNRAPYYREYREARDAAKAAAYDAQDASRRANRAARKAQMAGEAKPQSTATFKDVKSKYRSIEARLADLEKSITSSEWQLRREFRDLEN